MSQIRYGPLAYRDLSSIFDHVAAESSEERAAKLVRRILDCVNKLAFFPYMGLPCEDLRSGWRSFPEEPYRIYYRALDSGIELLRIVHGCRDQREALGQTDE